MAKGNESFRDLFGPYNPNKGDLMEYLSSHDGTMTDNLFRGPEYFENIRALGLMVPGYTIIRVDMSPAPDIVYFVNDQYKLESGGRGLYNMSAVGAEKGVYNPKKVLKNKNWSILSLKLPSH